jgi:hypothetical protein
VVWESAARGGDGEEGIEVSGKDIDGYEEVGDESICSHFCDGDSLSVLECSVAREWLEGPCCSPLVRSLESAGDGEDREADEEASTSLAAANEDVIWEPNASQFSGSWPRTCRSSASRFLTCSHRARSCSALARASAD